MKFWLDFGSANTGITLGALTRYACKLSDGSAADLTGGTPSLDEVDSTNLPGLYILDVPNVTENVRGKAWVTALPAKWATIAVDNAILENCAHGGAAATFVTAAGVLAQESVAGKIESRANDIRQQFYRFPDGLSLNSGLEGESVITTNVAIPADATECDFLFVEFSPDVNYVAEFIVTTAGVPAVVTSDVVDSRRYLTWSANAGATDIPENIWRVRVKYGVGTFHDMFFQTPKVLAGETAWLGVDLQGRAIMPLGADLNGLALFPPTIAEIEAVSGVTLPDMSFTAE